MILTTVINASVVGMVSSLITTIRTGGHLAISAGWLHELNYRRSRILGSGLMVAVIINLGASKGMQRDR